MNGDKEQQIYTDIEKALEEHFKLSADSGMLLLNWKYTSAESGAYFTTQCNRVGLQMALLAASYFRWRHCCIHVRAGSRPFLGQISSKGR